MKRGRYTGKPTKEESERIVAVKEANCVACEVQSLDNPFGGCDAHHLLSGGRRRGHMFVVGLCPWHHRAVPVPGYSPDSCRTNWGPSLMDGSKRFRDVYGSDEDLLALQERILKGTA